MDATSCDTVVIIGASSTAFMISSSDVVDDAGGGPGPGAEVSYVAAWGELEEIEAVDTAQFKAGEVVEGRSMPLLILQMTREPWRRMQ